LPPEASERTFRADPVFELPIYRRRVNPKNRSHQKESQKATALPLTEWPTASKFTRFHA